MTQSAWWLVLSGAALAVGALAWLALDAASAAFLRYRVRFTHDAGFRAREFFLFVDPSKLFAAHVTLLVLGGTLVWSISAIWPLALASSVVLAWLPRALYAFLRQRRLRQFEAQLPDALLMLAGGVKAGAGLAIVLHQLVAESAPPLSQEFSLMLREQRLGLTLEQTLANLARRVPTEATLLMVSAMHIAHGTGGSLADALERAAQTVRARLQMEQKICALTAQGKLQAWVVGALPLVLMAVLGRMEPEAMRHLWHSPMGWGVLATVLVLEVTGVMLIRRVVNVDV